MYDTPFQFLVLQESGIRSIAEMAGKRVGVGPRGGTSAAYIPQFFQTLKIPVNLVFGDWAELATQVHQRTLDVLAVGAGVPFPSFVELEAKNKVRYIALSSEQIATLRLAMPELTSSRIPAGTYPSLLRHFGQLECPLRPIADICGFARRTCYTVEFAIVAAISC